MKKYQEKTPSAPQMPIYQSYYHSFLIRVSVNEQEANGEPFTYRAIAYNPETKEKIQSEGASDTEALHKLRGKIDDIYGKPRVSGN